MPDKPNRITADISPDLTDKKSVIRAVVIIFMATFLLELTIMFLLHGFSEESVKEAVIDASLLIVFLVPFLYFSVFLPMLRQTNSELNRTKSLLEEAQRLGHLGHWEWDIRDNSAGWSDEMYRIFGVSQTDFKPSYDNFLSLVHPDDKERVARIAAASLAQGSPYDVEYNIVRPDGTGRFIHAHARTRSDEQGQQRHWRI